MLSRLAVASNRAELEEVRRRVKFADLQGKWSRSGDKAKLHLLRGKAKLAQDDT